MATVRDVITTALKEIGVLAAGETATADDAADGFAMLNRLIDQKAAERLFIYTVTRTTWTIVSGTGTYTVGTGGTVNVARPVIIEHISFQDTSTSPDTEYPLHELTENAWAALRFKDQTDTLPVSYYYNPTFPLGTLKLWPAPTSATLEGVIYHPQAVTQFAGLTTSISLPPGYEEFLVTNLAVRMTSTYGRALDPMLLQRAREAEGIIKRANKRLVDLTFDAGALIGGAQRMRGYDITQG